MRVLIWDFDGTLGYREGGMWSATLLELLEEELPQVGATRDQLRPHLQSGFPWHRPDQPHPEIRTPKQWWESLLPVFEAAFQRVGVDCASARCLARKVRHKYTDPGRWRLFDDVLPTLDGLSARGWTHVLLSNHVPELSDGTGIIDIIGHLGLRSRLARVFNSAESGYEKPHPRAFQMVLNAFPAATAVWMIGDSVRADIKGAEALLIPTILIDRDGGGTGRTCTHIAEVPALLARRHGGPRPLPHDQ